MQRRFWNGIVPPRSCALATLKCGVYPLRMLHHSKRELQKLENEEDIEEFLSKPSWSVKSLLPTEEQIEQNTAVTPKQLRHLLRLSALPQPASEEEESKLLRHLRSQLHFVKEIQKVDTEGVIPLRSIRDESPAANQENEITAEKLKDALAQEEVVGTHFKRIRRKNKSNSPESVEAENWDVLGQAPRKVGKYFVVDSDEG